MSRVGIRTGAPPAQPGTWPLNLAPRPDFFDDPDRACNGQPPELFFPTKDDGKALHAALAICRRCPVMAACREWAVPISDLYGVVGGTTFKERKRIRAARAEQ